MLQEPENLVLQTIPLLTFQVAGEDYALRIDDVVEVVAMVELKPLHAAHPAMLGLANRHGQALPVVDLPVIFGLPPTPINARTLFIVVQQGELSAGLVVDEVFQVQYVAEASVRPAPGADRYVGHLAQIGESLLRILTLSPVLTEAGIQSDREQAESS